MITEDLRGPACGCGKNAYGSYVVAQSVAYRLYDELGDQLQPYVCPRGSARWHLRNIEKRLAKIGGSASPLHVAEVKRLAQAAARLTGKDHNSQGEGPRPTGQWVDTPVQRLLANRKPRHNRFRFVRKYARRRDLPRVDLPRREVVGSTARMLAYWTGSRFDDRDPLYRRQVPGRYLRRRNRSRERAAWRRALLAGELHAPAGDEWYITYEWR